MTKRDQLRIKSYFTKSVDQAIAQAREELGPDAMLLNTRRTSADRPEGEGYEVVFGVAEELPAEIETPEPAPAPLAVAKSESATPDHLASELQSLHDQM